MRVARRWSEVHRWLRARWRPVAGAGAIVLLITGTLAAAVLAQRAEERAAESSSAGRAERIDDALVADVRGFAQSLDTAAPLILGASSSAGFVRGFDRLGVALRTRRGVRGLVWAPRVRGDAGRAAIERAVGAPIRETAFLSIDMRPAARRGEYYPAAQIAPATPSVLGFDFRSTPLTWPTLARARDTGEAAINPPLTYPGIGLAVLVVQPVYAEGARLGGVADRRSALEGFVVGLMRVGDLPAFSAIPPDDYRVQSADGTTLAGTLDSDAVRTLPVEVPGPDWTLSTREDTASSFVPALVGVVGVALAGAVAILLLLSSRRERAALGRVAAALEEQRQTAGELARAGEELADRNRELEDERVLLSGANARLLRSNAGHAALERLSRAAVDGADAGALQRLVASEAAALADAELGMVARVADGRVEVVGVHVVSPLAPTTEVFPLADGLLTRALDVGAAAGTTPPEGPGVAWARALVDQHLHSAAAAAVSSGARAWGVVAVAAHSAEGIRPDARDDLARLAHVLGIAISSIEARAALEHQAATDGLTGLVNHRAFMERIAVETRRARRHGRPLALIAIDVDRFKRVNDAGGHLTGDEVLRGIGEILRAEARNEDVVARTGGDEFAWLMPEASALDAWRSAERLRERVRSAGLGGDAPVTVSCGVCDLEHADSEDAMLRLADGALYWSKHHGRDCTFRYTPEVVEPLSDAEHAEMLGRRQTLLSVRSLARAVDVKDPSTREHSERVAATAALIARELGWAPDDASRLREAGLVHDVGKIAVPDEILFKPGPLDPAEYEKVKPHAELGARIVAEALDAEQTEWVRRHHERWDGGGYPDGVSGEEIPQGARILAVADAWDVMTASRPYREALTPEAALAELGRAAGTQFWWQAVEAMRRLVERGAVQAAVCTAEDASGPVTPGG